MAETPLEQAAKAAPNAAEHGKKEEPRKMGTLESVVEEFAHGAKSALKLGTAAAIPFAQASMVPYAARDTYIMTGAQVAADATTARRKGEKFTLADTIKSSVVGTAVTVPIYHTYNLMNKIALDSAWGYLGRAGVFGGIVYPAFFALYQPLNYLVRNLTFKGLGKYLKENYWPTLKKAWKTVLPFGLANVLFAPAYLQIPIGALLSYAVALFGAPKKNDVPEDKKRDKTPYLAAAASAFGRGLRKVFYGVPEAVYAAGKSIGDFYNKSLKPSQPSAPAAQPAAAPAH